MGKTTSIGDQGPFRVVNINDVEKMIPKQYQKVIDLLQNTEDEAIVIMRHFNWNYLKVEGSWFDMSDAGIKVGLEFDKNILKSHPEI